MNLEHIEYRLRLKQHEVLSILAGVEAEYAAEESYEESCHRAAVLAQVLTDVQEALRRLGEGNYHACVACGQPIEPARLKAIPWTLYCQDDQHQQNLENKPSVRAMACS